MVIVDIIDEPLAQADDLLSFLEQSPEQQPFLFGAATKTSTSRSETNRLRFRYPNRQDRKTNDESLHLDRSRPKPSVQSNLPSAGQQALLESFQHHLSSDFGNASSIGILTPDIEFVMSPKKSRFFPRFSQHTMRSLKNLSQITSVTSASEPKLANTKGPVTNKTAPTCHRTTRLDLSKWTDGRPFEQQLGPAKVALYSTLGEFDETAAVKLARLFLYFGFAAEAKQILTSLPALTNAWPELIEIADVIEGVQVKHPPQYFESEVCNDSVKIWPALSGAMGMTSLKPHGEEILLELSAMPIQLREILAPKMSALFLKANNAYLAKAALETISRTENPQSEQLKLEYAEALIFDGKSNDAIDALAEISSNSQIAAKAFARKIGLQISLEQNIDPGTLALLEGYLIEYKGTNLEGELKEVLALALSKSLQFSKAIQIAEAMRLKKRHSILASIYTDIVTIATDANFAMLAYNAVDLEVLKLKSELSVKYTTRLYSLGFVEQAERFLNASIHVDPNETFRLTAANIFISLNQPAKASDFIEGLKSKEAILLQARIQGIKGNFDKASTLYQKADVKEDLRVGALKAKNWQDAFGEDTGPLGQLARLSLHTLTSLDSTPNSLTKVEQLLRESNQSRALISSSVVATSPSF